MAIQDRSSASALIPEDVAAQILQEVPAQSVALQLIRRVTMSRKQQRMPVLAALPTAGFLTAVDGDTDIGFKPLTVARWANRYLNAEPLGAVVAIPEDVLDDSDYNLWGEIRPRLVEAIGAAIDAAVFFGAGAPDTWPASIVEQAIAAGNEVVDGTGVDLAADINESMGLVERYGFEITGHAAAPTIKARLRGLRDQNNQPIYVQSLKSDGGQDFSVYGYPTAFFRNGAWDPDAAEVISGDFNQAVLALRQDITYKILTESTLYGPGGLDDPVIALAQQDMVALRVVCRVAYQTAEPLTALSGEGWSAAGGSTTGLPFSVVTPSGT